MERLTFREFIGKVITYVPRHAYRFMHRTDYYYDSKVQYPYRGYEAMQYLLKNFEFESVLDVGCGMGDHTKIFLDKDKDVTTIDYGQSPYFLNGILNGGVEISM